MIGLDTNVLVRYLTQDDPKQSAQANHLIEIQCSKDSPGFINSNAGCTVTYTFDQKLSRHPSVRHPS
jgi:predicted nucleic-acid-binding protein